MAQPSAPPPYDDKNPLYPPSAYPQPSHYAGGYPQPGGYPAPAGYAAPGGYGTPGGYPQPGMAMPTMPMRFGDNYGGDGMGGSSPIQSADWDDRKVRHTFIRKVYAIISVQLLVTVGIIAMFTFV
ncbi:protein lifeguard 3-like [Lagopus leucura]|uniref:protein lifeguard 3-like n=1 Tax=Lagopus leucura TaxID=30410 RepID=UPI001C67C0F5|nr:protein lifeguard 3-like [Lagopus leucura]XP_042749798.1 protein lifeguard 3-like [Lagopus leucura]XP_042749799.1 protein lifeguard 3-like [Lagopus leucura]